MLPSSLTRLPLPSCGPRWNVWRRGWPRDAADTFDDGSKSSCQPAGRSTPDCPACPWGRQISGRCGRHSPCVMTGLGPVTHHFAARSTAGRGRPAFAGHDTGGVPGHDTGGVPGRRYVSIRGAWYQIQNVRPGCLPKIGAEEGLRLQFGARIADQRPPDGHGRQAGVVPDRRAGGDLDDAIGTAAPKRRRVALPNGPGVVQDLAELGQGLALEWGTSAAPAPGWCGGIQIGIEAQSRDDTEMASDGREELDGGESGVAGEDDTAAWRSTGPLSGNAGARSATSDGSASRSIGRARSSETKRSSESRARGEAAQFFDKVELRSNVPAPQGSCRRFVDLSAPACRP